ncbi:MAG: exodeoxyribonuclease VII small subunit [Phycisphaerales bacterium]|nr:exodeoxyribonuclease VII small subunit [Phycisphaerales bacterium]
MAGPAQPAQDLSFEQALENLESIIERIEQGEVGLEQSLAEYERGVDLIKRCRAILERAEQKVEDLTGKMMGDSASN